LTPVSFKPVTMKVGGVGVRVAPDLVASEGKKTKYLFLNPTLTALDPEVARRIIEISYDLLSRAGVAIGYGDVEIIDLPANRCVTNPKKPRSSVLKTATSNGQWIVQLWPII